MAVETFREETFSNPFQEILISPLSLKLEFTTIIHIGALIRIKIQIHWLRSYGVVEKNVCDGVQLDADAANYGYAEAGETWSRKTGIWKRGSYHVINPRPRGPCLVTK